MPVLDFQIPSLETDREHYLLWLRAETFAFELEKERHLRSLGRGTLPEEWHIHLERERQEIFEQLRQYERDRVPADEVSVSPRYQAAYPSRAVYVYPPVLSHTPPPHTDNNVAFRQSTGGYYHSTACPNPTPSHHRECVSCRPSSETDPLSSLYMSAFQGGAEHGLLSLPQGHPSPFETTSLAGPSRHPPLADRIIGNATLIRRSPAPRALALPHVDERPSVVSGILNGAQHTTIIGGVFYAVQGNVYPS